MKLNHLHSDGHLIEMADVESRVEVGEDTWVLVLEGGEWLRAAHTLRLDRHYPEWRELPEMETTL
jgi:hypothetical protein